MRKDGFSFGKVETAGNIAFLYPRKIQSLEMRLMAQHEIYKYLLKHGESRPKDIAKGLDIQQKTVSRALRRMEKFKLVRIIEQKIRNKWIVRLQ